MRRGGGSGQFAWQFLHRLRHHHLPGLGKVPDFQYLLTDGAARNIDHWNTLTRFTRLREEGVLAFGQMLVQDTLEIQTQSGTLGLADLGLQPVILIGNYLHCSIRCDLVRVRQHQLYDEWIALQERDPASLEEDETGPLHRIKPRFSALPRTTPSGHALIDGILEAYCQLPGDHCIPVPESSIRFLELFLQRDAAFMHLSADLGYTDPATIPAGDPFIFDHYLAIRTNYHMMGEIFRAYDGFYQFPAYDTPHFTAVALMRPPTGGHLEGTQRTARQVLQDVTPLDVHNVQKLFRKVRPRSRGVRLQHG